MLTLLKFGVLSDFFYYLCIGNLYHKDNCIEYLSRKES